MESRNTQIANELLINLLSNYNETQIRIFLATINKAVTKHYAITTELNRDDIYNYDSLEVDISLEFYRQYIKGIYKESNYRDIIKGINIPITLKDGNKERTINIIDEIIYNKETKVFTVKFDEEYFEYVIILSKSDYTVIDLEEVKLLSGKYEIGVYLCYWQFITKGIRLFTIDTCRNFFDYDSDNNRELMRFIRNAVDKVNKKLGYKINVETEIKNRKTTNINLVFPKGKKKV